MKLLTISILSILASISLHAEDKKTDGAKASQNEHGSPVFGNSDSQRGFRAYENADSATSVNSHGSPVFGTGDSNRGFKAGENADPAGAK